MNADDRFVEEYAGFVRGIACKTREQIGAPCEIDDLVAYGFGGLLEARKRFDPAQGVPFKSFAYYRIRGAIIDGVRKMSDLPRRAYARLRAATALDTECEFTAVARLTAEPARPDPYESLKAIDTILGRVVTAYCLEVAPADDERSCGATPEEIAAAREQQAAALRAIEQLPERERLMLHGVYFENLTIEDAGRRLGLSKSWSSRMHGKALDMLREAVERPAERRG